MEQLQFPELVTSRRWRGSSALVSDMCEGMVSERPVPIVKVGHYVRFDLADIRKFVEQRRRPEAS